METAKEHTLQRILKIGGELIIQKGFNKGKHITKHVRYIVKVQKELKKHLQIFKAIFRFSTDSEDTCFVIARMVHRRLAILVRKVCELTEKLNMAERISSATSGITADMAAVLSVDMIKLESG